MIIGMTEGIFTEKKLTNYLNINRVEYSPARKIINGNDEKVLTASYAKKFEVIQKQTSKLSMEF